MSSYLLHLAQVNEIQNVSLIQDLHDQHGNLILNKGQALDFDTVEKLLAKPLPKSFEKYVAVENGFTANTIYEIFNTFVFDDPHFAKIYGQRDLNDKFVACIEYFCRFDILRQKLNILAVQLPDVFEQALFCAWMGTTAYAFDNHPQQKLNDFFLAALTHDLGLLEVSPGVLFAEGKLSAQQWKEIQDHPRLSALILRQLKEIDEEVVQAVYQHHENPDGTGYPNGKMERQLNEMGMLLNTLDSVYAIYRKHFKPRGRSLNDLVPVVQMAILSRGSQPVKTLLSLLRKSSATEHCTLSEEQIPDLIGWVKRLVAQIVQFVEVTTSVRRDIGTKHKDMQLFALQNMARHINRTLTSCGIINDAYLRWLDQVSDEKLEFAYRELEDVLLMLIEITYHMERFERLVSLYVESESTTPEAMKVHQLRSEINGLSKVNPPENLVPFINSV